MTIQATKPHIEPAVAPSGRGMRWLVLLLACVALLPGAVPLGLILHDGVNVPYLDQWEPDLMDVSLAASHGHLSPLLLTQHNEHRVLIPKLCYMALDPLSHGNVKVQMLAEWVVVLATSGLLLMLLLRTVGTLGHARPVLVLLLWLACNLLLFSPVQSENWLWGIGLINVFPAAWILAMLLVLHVEVLRPPRVLGAILLATAATFSSGNGILAWPLGAVLLGEPLLPGGAPAPARQRQGRWLLVWTVAAGASLLLFFHGHQSAAGTAAGRGAAPLIIAGYVLAFLGSPFALLVHVHFSSWAAVFGAGLLVPAGALVRRWMYLRQSDRIAATAILVWGCVAGFAVLSGMMAGLTRAGLGIEQAITSRYTTFALYLPLALIGCAGVLLVHGRRGERMLAATVAVGLPVLTLLAYPAAFRQADIVRVDRQQGKAAVLLIDLLPDNPELIGLVYPDPGLLHERADRLNAAGWIRPPLLREVDARVWQRPRPAPPEVGAIEHVSAVGSTELNVTGWALRPGERVPADAVLVTCEEGDGPEVPVAMARLRVSRPDIARRLGHAGDIRCGWTAVVPVSHLASALLSGPGHRVLRLHAWSLEVNTARATRLTGELPVQ